MVRENYDFCPGTPRDAEKLLHSDGAPRVKTARFLKRCGICFHHSSRKH